MSPYAVKRASYNLAVKLVNDEGEGFEQNLKRFTLVTGFDGGPTAAVRFAKLIVEVGR